MNQGWLCDKGRYGYEWVHSRGPRARADGAQERRAGRGVVAGGARRRGRRAAVRDRRRRPRLGRGARRRARHQRGRLRVGALRQGRARHRQRRRPARRRPPRRGRARPARAPPSPTSTARAAIVLVGPDLKEELPVLYLRVRRAAVELGVPVIELAPRATGLTRDVTAVLRHAPGEAGAMARAVRPGRRRRRHRVGQTAQIEQAVERARRSRRRPRRRSSVASRWPSRRRRSCRPPPRSPRCPDVKFLSALRRGNVRGALDLGLTPGFLPGRVTLDAGRDHFADAWGSVPERRGLDAAGILDAAAGGSIEALVLLGAEPEHDFPDRIRMRAGARRGAVRRRRRRVHVRRRRARRRVPPHLGVG